MTEQAKKKTNISRINELVVLQKIKDAKKKPRKVLTKTKHDPDIIFDCMGQMIFNPHL